MKLIARNIIKCAMKQGDPKAAWYFFHLSRELLANCGFKKKYQRQLTILDISTLPCCEPW